MAQHNKLGVDGERVAAEYLTKHGYDIVETNWRSGRFELDIIAVKEDMLIVAEVKTRTDNCFNSPEDAVNFKKIRHIVLATDHYMKLTRCALEVRFDIITVIKQGGEFLIDHIQDAFYPPLG